MFRTPVNLIACVLQPSSPTTALSRGRGIHSSSSPGHPHAKISDRRQNKSLSERLKNIPKYKLGQKPTATRRASHQTLSMGSRDNDPCERIRARAKSVPDIEPFRGCTQSVVSDSQEAQCRRVQTNEVCTTKTLSRKRWSSSNDSTNEHSTLEPLLENISAENSMVYDSDVPEDTTSQDDPNEEDFFDFTFERPPCYLTSDDIDLCRSRVSSLSKDGEACLEMGLQGSPCSQKDISDNVQFGEPSQEEVPDSTSNLLSVKEISGLSDLSSTSHCKNAGAVISDLSGSSDNVKSIDLTGPVDVGPHGVGGISPKSASVTSTTAAATESHQTRTMMTEQRHDDCFSQNDEPETNAVMEPKPPSILPHKNKPVHSESHVKTSKGNTKGRKKARKDVEDQAEVTSSTTTSPDHRLNGQKRKATPQAVTNMEALLSLLNIPEDWADDDFEDVPTKSPRKSKKKKSEKVKKSNSQQRQSISEQQFERNHRKYATEGDSSPADNTRTSHSSNVTKQGSPPHRKEPQVKKKDEVEVSHGRERVLSTESSAHVAPVTESRKRPHVSHSDYHRERSNSEETRLHSSHSSPSAERLHHQTWKPKTPANSQDLSETNTNKAIPKVRHPLPKVTEGLAAPTPRTVSGSGQVSTETVQSTGPIVTPSIRRRHHSSKENLHGRESLMASPLQASSPHQSSNPAASPHSARTTENKRARVSPERLQSPAHEINQIRTNLETNQRLIRQKKEQLDEAYKEGLVPRCQELEAYLQEMQVDELRFQKAMDALSPEIKGLPHQSVPCELLLADEVDCMFNSQGIPLKFTSKLHLSMFKSLYKCKNDIEWKERDGESVKLQLLKAHRTRELSIACGWLTDMRQKTLTKLKKDLDWYR